MGNVSFCAVFCLSLQIIIKNGKVKTVLMRLVLVACFLCGFLDSHAGIKQQPVALSGEKADLLTGCDDSDKSAVEGCRSSFRDMLRPASSSHRVCSSRPVRLLPTYGGKSGSYTSPWAKSKSLNLSKYASPLLSRHCTYFRAGVASPRRYYVITLRRLLC